MDSTFTFELGSFPPGFTPTSSNVSQWSTRWQTMARAQYDPVNGRFSGVGTYSENFGYFQTTNQAYIWGFNANTVVGEWVLVSHPDWKWPLATGGAPLPLYWPAEDANTAVIGNITTHGVLFRSTSVLRQPLPKYEPQDWRALVFSEEQQADPTISNWASDPDQDGVTNWQEFLSGTNPLQVKSVPTLTMTRFNNKVSLILTRNARANYGIFAQTSKDLSEWTNYTELNTLVVALSLFTTEPVYKLDLIYSTSDKENFYRLLSKNPPDN